MHTAPHHHTDAQGHDMSDCIEACSDCYEMCQHMIFQHCLQLGGKHTEPEHLKLMADCAQLCRVSADFMLRGSPRHMETCRLCAEVCDACASDCERIGEMDDCVTACRRCAESCRQMAA